MMSERRACILIAAVLMLFGAVFGFFVRQKGENGNAREAFISSDNSGEAAFLSEGHIEESYGACFDSLLNQWSLNETMRMVFPEADAVCLPVSGQIQSITGNKDGTSRVCIRTGSCLLTLDPVFNITKFEGSRIEKGEKLCSAEGILTVMAEEGGKAMDPLELFTSIQP